MLAAPNIVRSKPLLCDTLPVSVVKSAYAPGFLTSTAQYGSTKSTIQTGWVHHCSLEISVTPCITSGMTPSDATR